MRFGFSRHAQGSERGAICEILNAAARNLSREFYKVLDIVLDRSQFNRIISHSSTCRSYWIAFEYSWLAGRWRARLSYLALFTRYRAARMDRLVVDDLMLCTATLFARTCP